MPALPTMQAVEKGQEEICQVDKSNDAHTTSPEAEFPPNGASLDSTGADNDCLLSVNSRPGTSITSPGSTTTNKHASLAILMRWVDLIDDREQPVEKDDLLCVSIGAEFVIIHNVDDKDFGNKSKWNRYIIKKARSN